MSSSDSENELSNTPPNIIQLATNTTKNLLPEKSRERYEKVYQQWAGVQQTIFYNKFQIPGVIGCIDCTHIAIFPPVLNHPINPEYIFVNRKGYHSINTQLICDSSLKILHVNARFPGRPWLLTPIQNPENPDEEEYNSRHASARATVERCNGLLKMRFRCLLKHRNRVLHYTPQAASKIINACVVLHNMCISVAC
ncbi:DDE superfamily endonuclease [Popillia japonica]|uniref:DDE superfamily endonuclease n=1 Tax=Popillia japonica TaxID=7064 RepID=A0AAW1KGU5_POPJA